MVAACGGGSPPAGASPSQERVQQLDNFARCMRSHGVANFYFSSKRSNPSPDAGGGTELSIMGYSVPAVGPGTPHFATAMKACKQLLPGGGPPPMSRQQIESMLRFARCMRAHGFPGYPDPGVSNGGVIQQPLPASINTSSPQFESAQKACNQ